MSDKPSLDSLRIDRAAPRPRRGNGLLIVAIIVVALAVAAGAGAYLWWPQPALAIHAVTVEADGGASGGAGLDASGYVVARRQATLSAKIMGKLVEVNVEEGQRVQQGQIVAKLDDSNYAAALRQVRAQAAQAKTALDDVTPMYERYKRLVAQDAISTSSFETQRAAYDAAKTALVVAEASVKMAQTNADDTVVRAPFSGVVTDKAAQLGEIVAPAAAGGGFTRTGIATIVDMDSLEVEVDVSENYIDRVRPGGQATVRLDAYPDWDIPASVIAVIPTADQSKGTVKVRIAIKAKDPRILPQMAARVAFLTEPRQETARATGVTVPLETVQARGRAGTVFVVRDDNTLEARTVALGFKTAKSITVVSGLAPGEKLASGDLHKLHDGAKVSIQE